MSTDPADRPPADRLLTFRDVGLRLRMDSDSVRRVCNQHKLPRWKYRRSGLDVVVVDKLDVERVFASRIEQLATEGPELGVTTDSPYKESAGVRPVLPPLPRLGGDYTVLSALARVLRLLAYTVFALMLLSNITTMGEPELSLNFLRPWLVTLGSFGLLLMVAESTSWAVDVVKALWAIEEHQRAARERTQSPGPSSPLDSSLL